MNEKKQMTVSDALRIAAWIFTAGALFLALIFIKDRPIITIGFMLIAFCICPLSEKIFKKIENKIKFNFRIPAIILSLVAFRGFIQLNNVVIDSMKNNDDNAVTTTAETIITEQTTTTIIETTSEKTTTVTTEETTESEITTTFFIETTVTETTVPPIITTILETEPPQTFAPVTEAQKIVVQKYVLNTSTKKVHKSTCRDVDKIAPENYDECDDLQWAFDNEYEPCGHCNPN